MFPRVRLLLACLPAVAALPALHAAPVDFNREIRPILNAHCIKCHGGVKEAGGLNLQFRGSALKAGESGEIAVVPGSPEKSAFMDRLTTSDPEDRMPRKEPPLPKEQVELLRRWIAEGAVWGKHWAYEPPIASNHSLDELVGARLQKEGLAFSPEAVIRTLARRMSLDLTGLPPELERVEALEKAVATGDKEAALGTYVDELLASTAYGERWAAPWLDLARYADSRGYEKDLFRDMWRYRDWVVDALNADMPYDRFVTEQLAGDLLPNPTEEQIIATAFHRNTPQNDEGGTDDEEFRTLAVLDRVNTTFDALQGTSMGCVQCHGHPYDAFVHREYYELMAFFNNTADADKENQFPTRKVFSRTDADKAGKLKLELDGVVAALAAEKKAHAGEFTAWLAAQHPAPVQALAASDPAITATAGTYAVQKDGRVSLQGEVPERTTLTYTAQLAPGKLTQIAVEALPDNAIAGKGPGGSGSGNFVITYVSAALLANGAETPLPIATATATFEQNGWPVAAALRRGDEGKNEGERGWGIAGGTGQRQTATFILEHPVEITEGSTLKLALECENERYGRHVLCAFRIQAGSGGVAPGSTKLPKDLQALLAKPEKSWKPDERARIDRAFLQSASPAAPALYTKSDSLKAALAKYPMADLPIMQELTGPGARVTKIFQRGNWLDKGETVEPKTPEALNPWPEGAPRNRLGFAQWLTNGANPLTARVQVNRLWEQLFGTGLVETLEDFGSQGDVPIYQDALDTLAVRFETDLHWSQKRLLRELVLSRVYRQSSKTTPALLERDPANRLLARGPRFRLSSEQLRDQALAIGGLLNREMSGPSVMPYQPPGTWLTPYEGRDWKTSPGEQSHRRALYTFIRRSATYPSMVTFDAPNREFCVVRRVRTNTPLQALDLLNSPVFMEAAAGLAKRMTGATPEEQIARGVALATLRPARDYEIAALTRLHAQCGGDMRLVANAILNLDEVQSRN